jgi:hypothetical protein
VGHLVVSTCVVSAPASAAVASAAIPSSKSTVVSVLALLLVASAALVSKSTKTATVLTIVTTEMTRVTAEALLVGLLRTALSRSVLCGRSWTTLLSAQGRLAGATALGIAKWLQGVFAGSWLTTLLLAIRTLA